MDELHKAVLLVRADQLARKGAEYQENYPQRRGVFGYLYGQAQGLRDAIQLIEAVDAPSVDYYREAAAAGQFDLWGDDEDPAVVARRLVAEERDRAEDERNRAAWTRALKAGLVAGEYQPNPKQKRKPREAAPVHQHLDRETSIHFTKQAISFAYAHPTNQTEQ